MILGDSQRARVSPGDQAHEAGGGGGWQAIPAWSVVLVHGESLSSAMVLVLKAEDSFIVQFHNKISEHFPGSWVGCCPALSSSCSKRGSSGKNKQMKHSILTNIWKYVKPKDQHAWEKLRFLWYLESTTTTCQTVSLTVWHDMYGMDICEAS